MNRQKPGPKTKPEHLRKHRYSVSMTPAEWRWLSDQAQEYETSVSDIIRGLIAAAMES